MPEGLTEAPVLPQGTILYDVSDVLSFLRRGLLLSGIQRVVFEIGRELPIAFAGRAAPAGAPGGYPVALSPLGGRLARVSKAWQAAMVEACRTNVVPRPGRLDAMAEEVSRTRLAGALRRPRSRLRLGPGGPLPWLVLLGSSWSRGNYAALRRALGRQGPFRTAVLVHDMLPIVRPDWTFSSTPGPFRAWAGQVADTADLILVPSEATRRNVVGFRPDTAPRTHVIDFGVTPLPASGALPDGLTARDRFLLYVSSLHVRKNHPVLVQAWVRAFAADPQAAPPLVLVGGAKPDGVAALRALVPEGPLTAKLHVLTRVDDASLAALYASCGLFVFPSRFEGWGLPVAEGLSFGKFGLVSDSSSLPEVGQGLVETLPPDDVEAWAARMRHYAGHPEEVAAREAAIRAGFKPRPWSATASQICRHLAAADMAPPKAFPT